MQYDTLLILLYWFVFGIMLCSALLCFDDSKYKMNYTELMKCLELVKQKKKKKKKKKQ